MGAHLSEYHTGYRAYSRELLNSLPLERNSDDFVFDNQILAAGDFAGRAIGEISCPRAIFRKRRPSISAAARSTVWAF